MQYIRPHRLEEALSLLERENTSIVAGGTDFYPGLRDGPIRTDLVDITAIRELRRIEIADGFWSIGAGVTWTDILRHDLPPAFDMLKLAGKEVGSVQIQNRATLAGNICNASPAADGVPPLLALDAQVELVSSSGVRRIALNRFIQGNRKTERKRNEIVSRILVPQASANGRSGFLKLGARKYLVISIVMAAVRLAMDGDERIAEIAVAVGACSAVAQRLTALENDLAGVAIPDIGPRLFTTDHFATLAPIDDIRSPAGYRMEAARELVVRTIRQAARGST